MSNTRFLMSRAITARVAAAFMVCGVCTAGASAGGVGANDAACNAADLAPPAYVLDIDDVLAYLDAFALGQPAADLSDPPGQFDIDDLLAFLDDFSAGCQPLDCIQQPSSMFGQFSQTFALVDLPGPTAGEYEFSGQFAQSLDGNGQIAWSQFQMLGLPIIDPALPPIQVTATGPGMGQYDPQTGVLFGGQMPVQVNIDGVTMFATVLETDGPTDFACNGPNGLVYGIGGQMATPFGAAFLTGICGADPQVVVPNAEAQRWCLYTVGFTSTDCPGNLAGVEICVACPTNGRCPNKLTLQLQGTDCWFQVKRQGGAGCRACPGNVPAARRFSFAP